MVQFEGMTAPARRHKATTRAGSVERVAGCNPEKIKNGRVGGIRAQRGTECPPTASDSSHQKLLPLAVRVDLRPTQERDNGTEPKEGCHGYN
jgi:hypothetical protein